MRILVIADPETCLAFSLAGIEAVPVRNAEEAARALENAGRDSDLGLVLITERLARMIREEVDRVVYTSHRPLVVEIPDTAGALADRPSARELMVSIMGR